MPNRILTLCICTVFFCFAAASSAEDAGIAPPPLQAALFVKLLSFHQGIGGGVRVHVMEGSDFARELKKVIGVKIGKSSLTEVTEGKHFPAEPPTVLYVGDADLAKEVIRYTREKKVLSITGLPGLIQKGITLGVGISGGKPRILLNISASKEEDIPWDHAILKVSTTF